MKEIIIIPEKVSPIKKYKYPFQEWAEILKDFECLPYDQRVIDSRLDQFKKALLYEKRIPLLEMEHFEMTFSVGKYENGIRQQDTCKINNLFTACILYNRYMPYSMLKENQTTIEFSDCSVLYDAQVGGYVLKPKGIELKMSLSMLTVEQIKSIRA